MQRDSVSAISQVIYKLKPLLVDYLEQSGIEISNGKLMKCINPAHNDKNPSCVIVDRETDTPGFYCYSCNTAGDIFTAATLLENKPSHGPGFITENLKYLADKFGIPVPEKELTEKEIFELQTYKAYN